ncbi:MAG: hypothetical protein ACR2RL_19230 [Gammaproteobacteria bacterium]
MLVNALAIENLQGSRIKGRILDNPDLSTAGDGITGANGSVLSVPVQVGNRRAVYRVIVSLRYGGDARDSIIVE